MPACATGAGATGGVNWWRLVGWGRVSDDDGHGSIVSSLSIFHFIHPMPIYSYDILP